VFSPSLLWRSLPPVEWLLLKLGCNLYMQTGNWLVSRELSEAAGPWDCRLLSDDDGEYFDRVLLASDGVRFVADAKSYYRVADLNSLSYNGRSAVKLEALFLAMTLEMRYLRALEESERTRLACTNYIYTWLHEFYPFRPDLIKQFEQILADLGAEFHEPRLSWKYDWIVRLFGWSLGRRVQLLAPRLRKTVSLAWDKTMFQLETRLNEPRPL
jgi:hypothetical protein